MCKKPQILFFNGKNCSSLVIYPILFSDKWATNLQLKVCISNRGWLNRCCSLKEPCQCLYHITTVEHWYLEYIGYDEVICKSQPLLLSILPLITQITQSFFNQSCLVQDNEVWLYLIFVWWWILLGSCDYNHWNWQVITPARGKNLHEIDVDYQRQRSLMNREMWRSDHLTFAYTRYLSW